MFSDLREFIKRVEELGECKAVEGADCDLEIGAITDLLSLNPDPPLLMFDKIKGSDFGIYWHCHWLRHQDHHQFGPFYKYPT